MPVNDKIKLARKTLTSGWTVFVYMGVWGFKNERNENYRLEITQVGCGAKINTVFWYLMKTKDKRQM